MFPTRLFPSVFSKISVMYILLEVVCLLIACLYGHSNGNEIVGVNLRNPTDILALPNPGSEPDFLWNVTGPTGSKILLKCPHLFLPKDNYCSSNSLTIDDGIYQRKLCNDKSDYEVISTGPQLTLHMQRKQGVEGRFDCTVQLSSTDPAPVSHGAYPSKNTCLCGWTGRQLETKRLKVKDFGFLAIIRKVQTGRHYMGGSILTERHILTYGGLLQGKSESEFDVLLGVFANETITQVRTVNKIVIAGSNETERFGLVELTKDIQFNPYVGPICLYRMAEPPTGEKLKAFCYDDEKEGDLPLTPTVKEFDTQLISYRALVAKPLAPKMLATKQFQYAMLVGYPLLYFDDKAGGYLQLGIQVYRVWTDAKPYKQFYVHADVPLLFPLIEKTLQELSPQHKTCNT